MQQNTAVKTSLKHKRKTKQSRLTNSYKEHVLRVSTKYDINNFKKLESYSMLHLFFIMAFTRHNLPRASRISLIFCHASCIVFNGVFPPQSAAYVLAWRRLHCIQPRFHVTTGHAQQFHQLFSDEIIQGQENLYLRYTCNDKLIAFINLLLHV